MRAPLRALLSGLLLAAALSAGCLRCPDSHVSVDQLVKHHNTVNTRPVPRLWARAKIQLTFKNSRGLGITWGSTSRLAATNGLLLLSKGPDPLGPHDFVLIGREAMGVDLFRVGSSLAESKYYLWYSYGDSGQAWWGRQELAGAPGIEDIPIDPNHLLSVLGVCDLPQDFTKLPTVVMRMSHDPCAYVLTYLQRQATTGRIVSTKEVWFRWTEKGPARPFLVKLLGADGQEVMVARLSAYKPISSPGKPIPHMPTDIRIAWPGKGSKVHIVLSEMTTEDKWQVEACRFLDPDTGDLPSGISPADVVQVDRALEAGGDQQ